ncbi:protein FAR1-RELATED SEQUENCE 7-like protein [Carex littledalei]|uniref:Protein FAR1-RELATED SEQUENCE 7-like protein n=1 Tax=Carex littledalei TaxID=544730 RepID=A0A833QNX4_9POAL|nr:protein FAR1-RELATED SEQUENCE 7-like protein [Carex littledalei]
MSIDKCGLPIPNFEEGEVGGNEKEKDDVVGDESKEEDVEGDESKEEDVGGDENMEPFVGMEFGSDLEARQFYNSYGCRLGFSIRVQTTRMTKVGLSSVRMVCSKQGLSTRQKQVEMRSEFDGKDRTPQKEISKNKHEKTNLRNETVSRCNCKDESNTARKKTVGRVARERNSQAVREIPEEAWVGLHEVRTPQRAMTRTGWGKRRKGG